MASLIAQVWERLIDEAPAWVLADLVFFIETKFPGMDDVPSSCWKDNIFEYKCWAKAWGTTAMSDATLLGVNLMIGRKLREARQFKQRWSMQYPDASPQAADIAMALMVDGRTTGKDAFPHWRLVGPTDTETILLQIWETGDAHDAMPVVCVDVKVQDPADHPTILMNSDRLDLAVAAIERFHHGAWCMSLDVSWETTQFSTDMQDMIAQSIMRELFLN